MNHIAQIEWKKVTENSRRNGNKYTTQLFLTEMELEGLKRKQLYVKKTYTEIRIEETNIQIDHS